MLRPWQSVAARAACGAASAPRRGLPAPQAHAARRLRAHAAAPAAHAPPAAEPQPDAPLPSASAPADVPRPVKLRLTQVCARSREPLRAARWLTPARAAPQAPLRPNKTLGQHFLVRPAAHCSFCAPRALTRAAAALARSQADGSVVKAALAAAGVAPGDRVLEVGPGTGVLTAALLAAGARVTSVEKDGALAAALAANNAPLVASGALTVVHDDALRWLRSPAAAAAFPDAAAPGSSSGGPGTPPPDSRAKVVANIPYAITTELLSALLPRGGAFAALTLLVQEELAQRLVVAGPGASDAREMSLRVRFYATPRYVRFVPRSAFSPPPRVDSAVVHFPLAPPHAWPLPPGPRTAAFFGFMRAAFASRRKMLRKTLAQRPGATPQAVEAALAAAGAPPDCRPQELALPQFLSLFAALQPEDAPAALQAALRAQDGGA